MTLNGAIPARERLCDRLGVPDALLSRSDLAELGLNRRAVDAVLRACPVVAFPGYSRPLVRVGDYLEFVERSTYRGDRVRGSVQSPVIPARRESARLQACSGPGRAIGGSEAA